MKVNEATIVRIRELSKIEIDVNIKKIAEGLGMTIREFYDCDTFDNLEQDE